MANVDAYKAKVTSETANLKTVSNVQKLVIDAVNGAAEEGAYFDEFKEVVEKATGKFAKYTLLKEYFQYVNDDNMEDYMAENTIFDAAGKLVVAMTNVKAVQDKIDQINLDAVVAAGVTPDTSAKPSKLNDYKAALAALELVNKETKNGGKNKVQLLEDIDVQLDKIATAQEKAKTQIEKAEVAMEAFAVAFGDDYDEEDVYKDVVVEIEKLVKEDLSETELATTTLDSKVTDLKTETEKITIIDDALAALEAFKEAFGEDADQEQVYTDVTDLLDLTAEPVTFAPGKGVSDLKPVLTALKDETAKWEIYNAIMATEDAAEMRDLLFNFEDDDYTDLTSAQKLEFAKRFIAAVADENNNPQDYNDVETLLGTELTAYTKLIDDVNKAEKISDMITALSALDIEAFDKLGSQEKSNIAEAVLAGAPYATVAAIVEAMGL